MLETVLPKWRGIARWPETVATVYLSEVVYEGPPYDDGPLSIRLTFSYRDVHGSIQSGSLVADSLTPLYHLRVDDTFPLRYSPRQPSRFYVPEASSLFTQTRLWFWAAMLICLLLLALKVLLGR